MAGLRRNVRIATAADEAALYVMLLELPRGVPVVEDIPVSPSRVMDQIKAATERGHGVIGIIDGDDGEIAASTGVFLDRWWWSEVPYHQAVWLFIREKYRGKINPAELFQFLRWAEDTIKLSFESRGQAFPFVTEIAHVRGGVRIEAQDRLWRRFGRRVGSIFLLN